MNISSNKSSKKKILIIVAAIVIVAAGLVGGYFYYQSARQESETKINYNPPTDNERQSGVAQKEENKKREEIDNNPSVVTSANVLITDAGQYDTAIEVRGYIDNVYDNTGTCTAMFTKGSLQVTKTNPGFKDAKTTQCGALDFTRDQFKEAGTWQLTLSFKSPSIEGSATKSVEIK